MQMLSSNYPHITDEMLSAYIDALLPEDEYNLVEAAIVADDEIAWRVRSLRQTVAYLNDLPEFALPRSFALPANMGRTVEPASATAAAMDTPQARRLLHPEPNAQSRGFLAGLREFLQGGNPVLRNAMAASMALVLLLIGAGLFMLRGNLQNLAVPQTASQVAVVESEVAAEDAAFAGNNAVENISAKNANTSAATANNKAAANVIIESTSTKVSVAMALTATPVPPTATPMAISEPIATLVPEPTTAEFVNPSVTPSKPLAAPTALPTPDIPLAQAPALSASTSTMSGSAAAPTEPEQAAEAIPQSLSVATESMDTVDADEASMDEAIAETEELSAASAYSEPLLDDNNVADASESTESTESTESIGSMSSRSVELPVIVAQSATASETEADTTQAYPSPLDALENAGSAMAAVAATELSDSADDAAGSGPSSRAMGAVAAAPPQDYQPIVIEVGETTGALTGQILTRDGEGLIQPIWDATIELVERLPDGTFQENRTDDEGAEPHQAIIDNLGRFIFFDIAPGSYGLQLNDSLLPQPSDPTQELVIEIKASEQTDLGILEYENLP